MGLFDRDNRGGYDRDMNRGGWGRVEQGFRGRDPNDVGMRGSNRGYGAEYGVWGGRDTSPTEAGWRAGGTNRDWNLGGRDTRMDPGHHPGGYDREMRGDDRNFVERTGDAMRRGWNDMTGGDYDRGYRGRGGHDAGYGMTGGGMNPGAGGWGRTDYGADYGRGMQGSDYGNEGRYGRGAGYDPGFPRDRGYDRHEFKSRQQTDAGDPYGDRQSRTPIRMVNEDYADRLARRNAYDADIRRDRDWF